MNKWDFIVRMLYVKLMHRITKYYPFSQFWKDRWVHYGNRAISHFRHEFRTIFESKGRDVDITVIDYDNYFCRMSYVPEKQFTLKDDEALLREVETQLNLPENTLYLRAENDKNLRTILVQFEVMDTFKDKAEKHPLW